MCSLNNNDKTELELAQKALESMKELENNRRHLMHTIQLSNGAILSFTNEEQLNECEMRYARLGVKVKKRYGKQ